MTEEAAAAPAGEIEGAPSVPVLCLLAFLAVMPVTLLVPILKPLVVDRYPIGSFAAHAFLSINMVGAILTAPLVGWFVDRLGGRRTLVAAAFLADSALLLALGWAPNYPALMAIRFLEGVTHIAALTGVMGAALGVAQRSGERAGGVMGAIGASIIFAVASGAGLGGALAKGGLSRPLLGAAVIGTVGAIVSAWALRRDRGVRYESGERSLGSLLQVARRDKAVLIPCFFTFSDRLTVGLIVSSFSLYLSQALGRAPSQIGLLMMLMLLPFAVLCYPFGKLCRRYSKSVMVAGGSILYGATLSFLAVVPPSWLPAWMLILGVVSAVNFTPSLAMVADLAGAEIRSSAMGAFNSAGSLGFMIGPLLGGFVVQTSLGMGAPMERAFSLAFITGGGAAALAALIAIPALVRLVRAGRTT